MTWWLWLIWSLLGYEFTSTVISRWVYQNCLYENQVTPPNYYHSGKYEKGRHAGKAWGMAHTWPLFVVFGPPVLLLMGITDVVEWYIKTDKLNARALRPHHVTTQALTEIAEAEYEKAGEELAKLQEPRPDAYGDGWKRTLNEDGSVLWTPRNGLGDEA